MATPEERWAAMEERLAALEAAQTLQQEQIDSLREQNRELREALWCGECDLPRGGPLSDTDIKRLVLSGRIRIDPMPDLENRSVLGTCKVDLRLGRSALILDTSRVAFVDFSKPVPIEYFREMDLQEMGEIVISPSHVIIATTLERVTLPRDIIGRMEGKSGIARLGGAVQAAPLFDGGWDGYPMLEMHNIGGVAGIARFGQRICAMSFEHLTSPTEHPYSSRGGVKYSEQTRARV